MDINNEIALYQHDKRETVFYRQINNETVWLIQAQIAQLFDVDRTVITIHIQNTLKWTNRCGGTCRNKE
jgi:hypothetical protein